MNGSPDRTLYSLQVLRGFAALMVVCYHYSYLLNPVWPGADIGSVLFGGGYSGVDVFFLISGFIIAHTTARREHAHPADFAIRRFWRVVPLAQVATLAYYLLRGVKPGAQVLLRSLLFLPIANADPPRFGFPVVSQEWTLTYELYFYAVFAAALVFTHRRRIAAVSLALAAGGLGLQLLLGGAISLYPNAVRLPAGGFGPVPAEVVGVVENPILLEFVAGMLLCGLFLRMEPRLRSPGRRGLQRALGAVLVAVFLGSFFFWRDSGNGILALGAGSFCLVAGALLIETSLARPARAPGGLGWLPAALWLGSASYSLYLVHFGITDQLYRRLVIHLGLPRPVGVAGFAILVAASVAIASAFHVLLERPFLRVGKAMVDWRRRLAGGGAPGPGAGLQPDRQAP